MQLTLDFQKTWVKNLIEFHSKSLYKNLSDVLKHILDAPITPELISNQNTESSIGRYDINDFIFVSSSSNGS